MGWGCRSEKVERSEKMKKYIIDTSVAVKWFCHEESDAGIALQLRVQLLDGYCTIASPDLLIHELANALKYNPNFAAKDVKTALNSVFDMGLDIKKADTLVTSQAIDIAFRFNVTVYDAYFMALSCIEKKPLITADYQFAKRVKGFKRIIRLSEMDS